jgi:predicted nucleic acid-binding protein
MGATKTFIDTNILLYLFSTDSRKADRAEAIVHKGGLISVQVLNEMTNVALRKMAMSWQEIDEALGLIRALCPVVPLTVDTHDTGRRVAERYRLGVYDAMIVAAALLAGCRILYSEDMHAGLLVDKRLHVVNPFQSSPRKG